MIKNSLEALTDKELDNLIILKARRHGSVGEKLQIEKLKRSMVGKDPNVSVSVKVIDMKSI